MKTITELIYECYVLRNTDPFYNGDDALYFEFLNQMSMVQMEEQLLFLESLVMEAA